VAGTVAVVTTRYTIRRATKQLKELIMATAAETQAAVDNVTAQLNTARDAIVAKINDGAQPDLTALQAAAQGIVDIVPPTA
jgi:CRISPR/Cas system CMR subunit Cmr4 (Cas7 group RAMP superfamily)